MGWQLTGSGTALVHSLPYLNSSDLVFVYNIWAVAGVVCPQLYCSVSRHEPVHISLQGLLSSVVQTLLLPPFPLPLISSTARSHSPCLPDLAPGTSRQPPTILSPSPPHLLPPPSSPRLPPRLDWGGGRRGGGAGETGVCEGRPACAGLSPEHTSQCKGE